MKIKIREPFYGAGTKYNWTKDGYHIWGVGIKLTDLMEHTSLEVETKGKVYQVDTKEAREFIKKYNSFYEAKNKTRLGVFSKSIMKSRGGDATQILEEWKKAKEAPENKQQKLI